MTYNASFNSANNEMHGATYDAAGNMIADPTGTANPHTYTYDAEGNLTGVDGGSTATYVYDALNQRVRINPTRGSYEFVFDIFGRKVSTWSAVNHSLTDTNIWSDSGIVAVRGGAAGSGTVFEHVNWVGTLRLRTNYNGTVNGLYSSLPGETGFRLVVTTATNMTTPVSIAIWKPTQNMPSSGSILRPREDGLALTPILDRTISAIRRR